MMGIKVQQEIPTGKTIQEPQTKIPSGKEPLNSQIAVEKPLGSPTKHDVGFFREDKGLGLSQVEERSLPDAHPATGAGDPPGHHLAPI